MELGRKGALKFALALKPPDAVLNSIIRSNTKILIHEHQDVLPEWYSTISRLLVTRTSLSSSSPTQRPRQEAYIDCPKQGLRKLKRK